MATTKVATIGNVVATRIDATGFVTQHFEGGKFIALQSATMPSVGKALLYMNDRVELVHHSSFGDSKPQK